MKQFLPDERKDVEDKKDWKQKRGALRDDEDYLLDKIPNAFYREHLQNPQEVALDTKYSKAWEIYDIEGDCYGARQDVYGDVEDPVEVRVEVKGLQPDWEHYDFQQVEDRDQVADDWKRYYWSFRLFNTMSTWHKYFLLVFMRKTNPWLVFLRANYDAILRLLLENESSIRFLRQLSCTNDLLNEKATFGCFFKTQFLKIKIIRWEI